MRSDRKFELVLYPDSTSYDCQTVLSKACAYFNEWAYILHDKDLDDYGQPKKPHFHFYGKSSGSPLTPQGVASQLGVPLSSMSNVSKWKSAVRYLTHMDFPEKYQYTPDSVVSNFPVAKLLSPDDDGQAAMIFKYIYDNQCCSTTQLACWCLENGCYSGMRRGFAIWSKMLNEMSSNS